MIQKGAGIVLGVLCVVAIGIATVHAAESGSLRLSGQVEPQLNVKTSLDWVHWTLRLDNASNVENEGFWIHLNPSHRIRLDRTVFLDLSTWLGKSRALPGKQFQVVIASP
jgi:hypothetical protein